MEKTVLLVDKDEEFIQVNKEVLEAHGFKVDSAQTVQEAMERFQKSKPDIIVTEIMLEHVDSGFTLCYSVKKVDPEMPIIILSDIVRQTGIVFDLNSKEEKEWIKADEFVNKPVSPATVLCKIRKYLEHNHAHAH